MKIKEENKNRKKIKTKLINQIILSAKNRSAKREERSASERSEADVNP